MLIQKPFYFLRHGQTDWNREKLYQGQTDIPLNEVGLGQAKIARNILRTVPITAIHSSSLSRASQTTDIINKEHDVPVTISDDLRECFYGSLEGQRKTDNGIDSGWRNGVTPEGAESYKNFSTGVQTALNHALMENGLVLIVAHRAVFWPIADILRLNSVEDIANAEPLLLEPPIDDNLSWRCTEVY